MSNTNQNIVKKAISYFKDGDFQQAKACYEQAAQQYGEHLFASSVRLCELRLNRTDENQNSTVSAVSQLEATQKLLEHYYTRCQELEYQLMDNRS